MSMYVCVCVCGSVCLYEFQIKHMAASPKCTKQQLTERKKRKWNSLWTKKLKKEAVNFRYTEFVNQKHHNMPWNPQKNWQHTQANMKSNIHTDTRTPILTDCYKFNKMAKIYTHTHTHPNIDTEKSICHKMLNGIHNSQRVQKVPTRTLL